MSTGKTFDDIAVAPNGEIASAVLLNVGADARSVPLHFLGVDDFQNIEKAVGGHMQSPLMIGSL
jgi:hypothetical protein